MIHNVHEIHGLTDPLLSELITGHIPFRDASHAFVGERVQNDPHVLYRVRFGVFTLLEFDGRRTRTFTLADRDDETRALVAPYVDVIHDALSAPWLGDLSDGRSR